MTERASEHQVAGPAAAARAPVSDAGPALAGLSSSVGNQAISAFFGGAGPAFATGSLALGTGEPHDATLQGGLAAAARARNESNTALARTAESRRSAGDERAAGPGQHDVQARAPAQSTQRAPVLARKPPEPAGKGVDKAKLAAIEQKLSAVAHRSDTRCDRILEAADASVVTLKDAKNHLKRATGNYKVAYTTFRDVLKRADKQWEVDKAIEDSVQGLLVAAALAVIGPEVLAAEAAKQAAVRMMASSNAVVSKVGVGAVHVMSEAVIHGASKTGQAVVKAAEGAAGEAAEQATGAGVDAAQDVGGVGVGPKPSDTAAGAGPSAGDKFEEAFGKLDALIDLLPQFGGPAKSQKALAMCAQELAKETLKLAGGGKARFTESEIEEKAKALEDEDAKAIFTGESAVKLQGGLLSMAEAITRTKIESASEIERKLWLRWMANADPQVLDNDEIEEYLGPQGKGMVDFGSYNFPWERRAAVNSAIDQWAKETTGAAPVASVPGATPAAPAPPPGPPPAPPG